MRGSKLALLALCFALWPRGVPAQVTLEASLGLQGAVRLEKWNLLTVTVRNTGPPLVGTLGVRIRRGSEFRGDLHVMTFTRPVELPHRSRKRFSFTVPIVSISHPLEVFLRTPAGVLVQQQLDLRRAFHAEHLILGITRNPDLDFLATVFQRHTRVVYLPTRALPQRWSGYDSITAIVVKGVSLQTLREHQVVALQQWVARGGTLVVVADAQFRLLQEPRMRALLPVRVMGLQQLEGLPALAAAYGMPVPAVPLLAVRSRLRRGEVLVGTADLPLLVQRSFGKGRIVFLAVDYAQHPLAGWRGNAALWRDMLQPEEAVDYRRLFAELGLLDDAHPVIKALGRPLLTYPSHLALSLFLLAYCGSLALLFWRMGKRGTRRGWYVGGVFFLVMGFSLGAYRTFAEQTLRHAAVLFDLTTMEVLADTGYAQARGYLGLFAVRGGVYSLAFQHPATVIHHTFARGVGKAGQKLEISATGKVVMRQVALEPWTLRVFSVESLLPAPLSIAAKRHPLGLTVQIRNRGPFVLQGATVLYQGKLFPLGQLAPGEEIFEDLYPALQTVESQQEAIWQVLFKQRPAGTSPQLAYVQEVLLQQYFGEKRLREVHDTPLLAGWLLAPVLLAPGADGLPVRGVTLVIGRLQG